MARRLLVLGGTGFLGVHVLRAAAEAGFETLCVARRPSPLAPGAFRPLDAEVGDEMREERGLAALLDDAAPTAVIQCAALARLSECDRDPAGARRVNAEFPLRLARLTRERGLRIVHVSTDLVFGARRPGPAGFAEDDDPGPTSVYGATKLAGERAVLGADPRALVARLPLLCGDSFGRALGASDAVVEAVRRGGRPLLFTDEVRTPLDVAVAARALVELATLDVAGLLHVAGPSRLTRLELGLRALRAAGVPDALTRVEAAPREGQHALRPADVSLDATRARALLRTPLTAPWDAARGP